tara:strand:+ start:560 stop:1108 length:549 start_codon:yes stop_codon:yes gene_type:complete
MKDLLCKLGLVLAIALIATAVGTEYWLVFNKSGVKANIGLWKSCFPDVNPENITPEDLKNRPSKCHTIPGKGDGDDPTDKKLKATRGLMIAGLVLLSLALCATLIPDNDFKYTKELVTGMIGIALVLLVVSLILYGEVQSKTLGFDGKKLKYGWSFYLAIAGLVVAAMSGGCEIFDHVKKMV